MVDGGSMDSLALLLKLLKHVEGGLKAVGDHVRAYISEACVVPPPLSHTLRAFLRLNAHPNVHWEHLGVTRAGSADAPCS
jgi:hypothetical protein